VRRCASEACLATLQARGPGAVKPAPGGSGKDGGALEILAEAHGPETPVAPPPTPPRGDWPPADGWARAPAGLAAAATSVAGARAQRNWAAAGRLCRNQSF